MLRRAAASQLSNMLRLFPIVVVSGPRRAGKSTLVRTHERTKTWNYRSLDELDNRAFATERPADFADAYNPAVIDEAQRVPDVVLALKARIDRDLVPGKGQYVLTGSTDLLRDRRIADSLAGRAGYMRLGPLTRRERLGLGTTGRWTELFEHDAEEWPELLRADTTPAEEWRTAVEIGGFPEVVTTENASDRARLLQGYVNTYLERDLRELTAMEQFPAFVRVAAAAAARTGALLNVAELSRDVATPASTVTRWLDLLEVSYLLLRLPAWARNRTTRLIKSPKLYFTDTALGLHLADNPELSGAHMENLVLMDLLAWRELDAPRPGLFHWRAVANREVDFVIERNGKVIAVEVKSTTRPHPDDWRHLEHFKTEYKKECIGTILLHGGTDTYRAGERMVVAPWWKVV